MTKVTRENLSKEKLYIVTNEHHQFNKGDIVYVDTDDGTDNPWFTKVNATNDQDRHRCTTIDKVEEWTPSYKPEPEVTEVTLEQIAAKFNIPTDQLRIKD